MRAIGQIELAADLREHVRCVVVAREAGQTERFPRERMTFMNEGGSESCPCSAIDPGPARLPSRLRDPAFSGSVGRIMAGRYGMSFAKKHIDRGDYEEAIAAASEQIDGGNASAEPLFDRGTAYELTERYVEAVVDFERAIEENAVEKELDPFMLDDAYFSATLAAARSEASSDLRKALGRLDRYRELLPEGAHVAESRDWQKRLRGEMPSLLDKTKDLDAV